MLVFMLSSKGELAAAIVVLATWALEILVDHPNTKYLTLLSHSRLASGPGQGPECTHPLSMV